MGCINQDFSYVSFLNYFSLPIRTPCLLPHQLIYSFLRIKSLKF